MIDLKTLKIGDEVLVKAVVRNPCDVDGDIVLERHYCNPKDIIEVIPKPFDWADVKAGMAFVYQPDYSESQIAIYIGQKDEYTRVFDYSVDGLDHDNCLRQYTRIPEKDIKHG